MLQKLMRFFRHKNQSKPKRRFGWRSYSFVGLSLVLGLLAFKQQGSKDILFLMATTDLNNRLLRKNKDLNEETYSPTLYLPFGFLQQLYCKYFETLIFIKHNQENIQNYLIHYIPVEKKSSKVIKNFVAQTKTSSQKQVQVGSKQQEKQSCVIVVGGSQGFNQLVNKIMVLAHSNKFQTIGVDPDDLHDSEKFRRIIKNIKQQRKGKKFYAIGIQYGANLMINAAAEDPTLFKCMVSIGNPLDLTQAERKLENSKIAKWTYGQNMLQGRINKSKLNTSNKRISISSIDNQIYNLKDQNQTLAFKTKHSSINHLSQLKNHVLFLNSKQDDFTPQFQNDSRIQVNNLLIFVLTKYGGHNEWFYSLQAHRWAPRVAISHLISYQKISNSHPQLIPQV